MRLINILVIAVLIGNIRNELRRERDATARLRAEWARLDTPDRIQGLAERHLKLKAIDATQFDTFDALPERPLPPPPAADPIATMLAPSAPDTTGSVPAVKRPR